MKYKKYILFVIIIFLLIFIISVTPTKGLTNLNDQIIIYNYINIVLSQDYEGEPINISYTNDYFEEIHTNIECVAQILNYYFLKIKPCIGSDIEYVFYLLYNNKNKNIRLLYVDFQEIDYLYYYRNTELGHPEPPDPDAGDNNLPHGYKK